MYTSIRWCAALMNREYILYTSTREKWMMAWLKTRTLPCPLAQSSMIGYMKQSTRHRARRMAFHGATRRPLKRATRENNGRKKRPRMGMMKPKPHR